MGSRDSLVDLERRKILYLLGFELGCLVCRLVGLSVGGLVNWWVARSGWAPVSRHVMQNRKIFVAIRIQTPHHPDGAKDPILTM